MITAISTSEHLQVNQMMWKKFWTLITGLNTEEFQSLIMVAKKEFQNGKTLKLDKNIILKLLILTIMVDITSQWVLRSNRKFLTKTIQRPSKKSKNLLFKLLTKEKCQDWQFLTLMMELSDFNSPVTILKNQFLRKWKPMPVQTRLEDKLELTSETLVSSHKSPNFCTMLPMKKWQVKKSQRRTQLSKQSTKSKLIDSSLKHLSVPSRSLKLPPNLT